jgi:O-antigen/teichoic acid export membrane protein
VVVQEEPELDTSGRRSARYRLSVVSAAASKAISLFIQVAVVPLTVAATGPGRYGFAMFMLSLTFLVSVGGVGTGNALAQTLTRDLAVDDIQAARRHVAMAFTVAGAGTGVAALACVLIVATTDWPTWSQLPSAVPVVEASSALLILIATTWAIVVLAVVEGAQAALIELQWASFFGVAGWILTLFSLAAATLAAPSLVLFVLAIEVPLIAARSANALLFFRRYPRLMPSSPKATMREYSSFLRGSGYFWLISSLMVATPQLLVVVVGVAQGPATAGVLATLVRAIAISMAFVALFVNPLWPALLDALQRRDRVWWERETRRLLAIVGLFGAVAVASTALLGQWGLSHWTAGIVSVSWADAVALGVAIAATSWGMAWAYILVGANKLTAATAYVALDAAITVGLVALLAPQLSVAGILMIRSGSAVLGAGWIPLMAMRRRQLQWTLP